MDSGHGPSGGEGASFSTDKPLHEVATEQRQRAAAGSGMRAVHYFAYSAAVALDPTGMVAALIEQTPAEEQDTLPELLTRALTSLHSVTAQHIHTTRKLAAAGGQLDGGEAALRACDDTDAADAVAAGQLAAADAFFAAVVEVTNPDRPDVPDIVYADLLVKPVKAARKALRRSAKANHRGRPAAATVLSSAAIALQ